MLLSENGKYPRERTPEIEKENFISRYVFPYIPYIPRKNTFRKNGNYSKI